MALPVVDAAVQDGTRVDSGGREDARRDACARARLADRHHRLSVLDTIRAARTQQPVGNVALSLMGGAVRGSCQR